MASLPGVHRQFVRAAMTAPFLTREEERGLALRWRGSKDQRALDQLCRAHMRLVIAIAARFRNYGLPPPDLIQEGHIGLMEAAARFEPERDVRFSTYATWWIRASIQDFVLRNWSIVRGGTSSAQKSLFFNLRRIRAKLTQGEPGIGASEINRRISQALGVSVADTAAMDARLSRSDRSLNAPAAAKGENEGDEIVNFLIDPAPLPDAAAADVIDGERRRAWIASGLRILSDREMIIVRARLMQDDTETLESLGAKLGVSKERVRQIETRALQKLRRVLLELKPGYAAANA